MKRFSREFGTLCWRVGVAIGFDRDEVGGRRPREPYSWSGEGSHRYLVLLATAGGLIYK